jgi:hypothetical protein
MLTHSDVVQVPQIIDLYSSILSNCSESAKVTCKPITVKSKAPFTKLFGDEINNDTIPHNGVTSLSHHFLGHICSIIHSTGLHSIWLEGCNSSKMLAYSPSASKLVSCALEAHCTSLGFNNNPHTNCIYSPGQNKVHIKCNIELAPPITIAIQLLYPYLIAPSKQTSPSCLRPHPPDHRHFHFSANPQGLGPFTLEGE